MQVMTRSSHASVVTILPQGAASTEEMGFKTDMKMRVLSSRIVKVGRLLKQHVKASASYAQGALERADVAG